MFESLRTQEFKKPVKIALIAGLSAAALTGCSSDYDALEASPVKRFTADYIWLAPIDGGNGSTDMCLDKTAYDVNGGDYGRSSFTPPATSFDIENDILTITPQQGEPLKMTGFDQDETVVYPVDETSKSILDAYGCEIVAYQN